MKSSVRKSVLWITACVLIVVSQPSFSETNETLRVRISAAGLQPLKEGTELIDFELENLAGESIKLSSYGGKVVFLNFWATWCGPCRTEMPSMQKLYDKYRNNGLEIVAVDLQEDRSRVQNFFSELDLTFTALLDTKGSAGATYGARNIPTTYIIDKKGYVIAGAIGSRDWFSPEVFDFFETLLGMN